MKKILMLLGIVMSISVLLSSAAFADLYGTGKGLAKKNTEEETEEDKNTDTEKKSDGDKDTKTLIPKTTPAPKEEKEKDKNTGEPTPTAAPDVDKDLGEDKTADQETYDFKKFHWGDSRDRVMEIEGEPDSEGVMTDVDSDYIVYFRTVAGKSAILAYYFYDDVLWQTRYILSETYVDNDLYIEDYETLKAQLTKKFGEPLLDWESWEDDDKEDTYKDNKGEALYNGYLSYWTWYQTDTTDIDLDMSADNNYISTSINFASLFISPDEPDYSDDF